MKLLVVIKTLPFNGIHSDLFKLQFGLIKIAVVPPASVEFQLRDGAYTVIEDADHLSICKPSSRDVETYTLLRDFVDQVRRRQVRTSTYIEPGYTNDIYLSIYLYIYLHCLSLLLHLPYTLVT